LISITRDAKVRLKLITPKMVGVDEMIRSFTNWTVVLSIPSKKDQFVPYKVDSKDIRRSEVVL
jgi:hypothetical protein